MGAALSILHFPFCIILPYTFPLTVVVNRPIPVIDLFAGPGGLGEGFAALGRPEGSPRFKIGLSIEKDATAHQTLELRAFFRQSDHGAAPEKYYQHVRGQLPRNVAVKAYSDILQICCTIKLLATRSPTDIDRLDHNTLHSALGQPDLPRVQRSPCLVGRG